MGTAGCGCERAIAAGDGRHGGDGECASCDPLTARGRRSASLAGEEPRAAGGRSAWLVRFPPPARLLATPYSEGGSAAEGCRVVAECGARRLRSSTAANNDAGRLTGGASGKVLFFPNPKIFPTFCL